MEGLLEGMKGQWEKEKEFLMQQLEFQHGLIQESKKVQKQFMSALTFKSSQQSREQQLLDINKLLSETVASMESKSQQQQEKLDSLKIFKKAIKNSLQIQCKNCLNFLPAELFSFHYLNACHLEHNKIVNIEPIEYKEDIESSSHVNMKSQSNYLIPLNPHYETNDLV
mmetsp:Transcript_29085/g.28078  ORF Transcript_29085/g.28078 Transcript_29085/m.28078 type:complete len:168 (+) Transcript_29085:2280-2783(+)